VLDASEDLAPSFFEVTAAATFLAFAEHPADACVIEVGLGGRFDATNVLDHPAACGVATLGIDHEAFLLRPEAGVPQEPLCRIAFEKAAIARPGSPLVTQAYPLNVAKTVIASAQEHGAKLAMRGLDWFADAGATIAYRDARGRLTLPLPHLAGAHQADNAALAVAMLRHQDAVTVSPEAMATGIVAARWPARLQRLGDGPLTALAPGRRVWLDGGHNIDAGLAIAQFFGAGVAHGASSFDGLRMSSARAGFVEDDQSNLSSAQPELVEGLHLITGMLANKDPSAIVSPLAGHLLSLSVVPAPGHDAHAPEDFAPFTALPVRSFADVPAALRALPAEGDVLIAGSLYLAGEVLRLNCETPE
jgi:dihydrofolate synthase/folylpolyglutamate synthase